MRHMSPGGFVEPSYPEASRDQPHEDGVYVDPEDVLREAAAYWREETDNDLAEILAESRVLGHAVGRKVG
jgi:hypothetical protein